MNHPVELRWTRLRPDASLPQPATAQAAGLDLSAAMDSPIRLEPGAIAAIPCGFAMALPAGYEAQVRARSGLALKHGISIPNAPGTIDADYRGEVKVPLINLGPEVFVVEPGMRVAQMVIAAVPKVKFIETESLDETDRGHGGFGSTGLQTP